MAVPRPVTPSVIDHGLATELRKIREGRNMSVKAVARRFGWSESKLSRVETCQHGVTVDDLGRLLHLYDVDPARIKELIRYAERRAVMSAARIARQDLLHGAQFACGVMEYAPVVVPRLLQTKAYALAVLESMQVIDRRLPSEVSYIATAIMEWQKKLRPRTYRVVIAEGALYALIGTPKIMAEQLERIASPPPWAQVRILPADAGYPMVPSGFLYLTHPREAGIIAPDAVLSDDGHAVTRLDAERDTSWFDITFSALWSRGENPELTIKRALDRWKP
jgi:transcriptional regulator with XRE-family HTH domain